MHRTYFIPILLPFFWQYSVHLCLIFDNILYTYLILKNASLSCCRFFWQYLVHLCLFSLFFGQYFIHLCLFFDNILYTYLILKKSVTPISFLSCCLFFFDNILYTYLKRLQTEYPNFHANPGTLISM